MYIYPVRSKTDENVSINKLTMLIVLALILNMDMIVVTNSSPCKKLIRFCCTYESRLMQTLLSRISLSQ
jgi:hypothetical protein